MGHDYQAIAETVYSIFERGATGELSAVFAPDFIEHDELPGSSATGLALVQEWVQMSHSAMPDARYSIESVVGSGNEAVCRVRMTGTQKGEMFGIPPTGRKVDVLVMDWIRLTPDGQIAEHWGTMQESKLMTQLGIPSQPTSIDITTPATTRV